MDVGFDIKLYGMDRHTVYLEGGGYLEDLVLKHGENFYDISEKENLILYQKFRVLGLQEHFTDASDGSESNNIIIKSPFLYLNFLLDGYPMSVLEDKEMTDFHNLAKLNAHQFKFLAIDSDDIPEEYKYTILSNIPKGKAMLYSDTDFMPSFDYGSASRRIQIRVRSYYPIHKDKIKFNL